MSLVTPIVLADGLDVTFYSDVEDVWFDVEPFFVEQDYRLYDATGRRLQLVPDRSVRPLEDTPTGADELAGLLRVWLPLAGVQTADLDRRSLPELLELAVEHVGTWEPSAEFPLGRGLGVAFLVGVAAVAALLVAAVQVWRERRWWPWVALHVVLIAVATAAALIDA